MTLAWFSVGEKQLCKQGAFVVHQDKACASIGTLCYSVMLFILCRSCQAPYFYRMSSSAYVACNMHKAKRLLMVEVVGYQFHTDTNGATRCHGKGMFAGGRA